jgi:hypothetical protein
MIVLGVFIIITQIKRFMKGEKDIAGFITRLLVTGIGFIVAGLIIIVKAFNG